MNNIQKAQDQGNQALQKLLSDKASRDQREEQQGVTNIDLLKNCVFSSVLPLKLDLLGAYAANTDKVFGSFLQNLSFYGVTSLHSKKKPVSFFLSLFGAVVDLDTVIEKLSHAQSEPDKYGADYHAYQEALQNQKPVGSEAQERYEHSKQETAQNSSSESGRHHGQSEFDKFSEGYRKIQHQNHENQNHNNHYNASNAWKANAQILEEIKRKHESHFQTLQKGLRDSNDALQRENQIQQAKRRR
jgi:hypothetical protein